MKKIKNRVTKLNKITVNLSNGINFVIVNDFKDLDGPVNSFNAALNNWLSRTSIYTAENFVSYVNFMEPERIFLTLEDYNKATEGKVEGATEEEYLAENN